MVARLRLSLGELWLALAVLLPALAALVASLSTVDLAYQVRAGQLMLGSGSVLRTDPFTFTAGGSAWLDQQWGAQLLLGAGYDAIGWAGLAVARAVVVAAIFALVLAACRVATAGPRLAALLTLGGFLVAAPALALRPQLFGMLAFAAATLLVLVRGRRPRAVWGVPLVTLVWANVHGSFVLAPALVAVALVDDLLARRPVARTTAAVLIGTLIATAITPFGPGVWGYAVGLSVDPRIRQLVTEWQPSSPLTPTGALFYASVVGTAVLLLITARRRPDALRWPWLLWLAGLAGLGVIAERGIAWWALGAPPIVAMSLAAAGPSLGRRSSPPERRSPANGAIVLALAAVGILLLPIWRGGSVLYGPPGLLTDAPRGVTEALRSMARPSDRLLIAQPWGSWSEFAVPGVPVMADSRIEVIPSAAWDDYLTISAGASGWSALADQWGITVIAASTTDQPGLIAALDGDPGWRRVESDAEGAVFVRADRGS